MEIIYRAVDGKEFDNEADCAYHESCLNSKLVMMNGKGERIDDTDEAIFVGIADDFAVSRFLAIAGNRGDGNTQGIDDPGLYMWDYDATAYRLITERELYMLNKLSEALNG